MGRIGQITTGAKKHPLYSTWLGMRVRCNWPGGEDYDHYGGRGIKVDPMWDDFWTFAFDMAPKPSPKHSLDRIDNNGPYAVWNCRWVTQQQQIRNSSITRYATVNGETLTLTEWAKKLGINQGAFSRKVARWGFESAILRGPKRISARGSPSGAGANRNLRSALRSK